MTIAANLARLHTQITDFEKKYHRTPNAVTLLAVTKAQPIESILEAIQAGQRHFGENYLQEALPKITSLASHPIEWHFIGPLQSNKTRKVAEHFSWVHTIDNINIAKRLNDQRPTHLPPLNICIQINISHEDSKSGITPNDITTLATECASLPRLRLRGLMTIPAPQPNLTLQRASFHSLFKLFQTLQTQFDSVDTLSMGMSDDFEAAIAEGSTMIRIGTALFGSRHR